MTGEKTTGTLLKLEVCFPRPVVVTEDDHRILVALTEEVCKRYERSHPGRVMWPFGQGLKMLVHPLMLSDDEPIPFDEDVWQIECSEREDYGWLCAKCGIKQGDHQDCILNPPAGACAFEPAKYEAEPEPEPRGLVPMRVYLAAVNGRREMRAALVAARARIAELEGKTTP